MQYFGPVSRRLQARESPSTTAPTSLCICHGHGREPWHSCTPSERMISARHCCLMLVRREWFRVLRGGHRVETVSFLRLNSSPVAYSRTLAFILANPEHIQAPPGKRNCFKPQTAPIQVRFGTRTCQARVSMRGRVTHVAQKAPDFTSKANRGICQPKEIHPQVRSSSKQEVAHLHGWVNNPIRPLLFEQHAQVQQAQKTKRFEQVGPDTIQ